MGKNSTVSVMIARHTNHDDPNDAIWEEDFVFNNNSSRCRRENAEEASP